MQFSYGYQNRMRGGYEPPKASQKVEPDAPIGKRIQRGPLRHSVDNRKYEYRGVSVDRLTGQEHDIWRRRNLSLEHFTRPGDWRPGVVSALSHFDDARARALWRSQMRNEADGLYAPHDIHRPSSIPYHPTEVRPNHLREHPIEPDETHGRAPTKRSNATQYLPDKNTFHPYAIDRDPYYVYDENAAIDDRTRPDTCHGRKAREPFVGQFYGTHAQRQHAKSLLETQYYPVQKETDMGDTPYTSRNRARTTMVDPDPGKGSFAILHPSVNAYEHANKNNDNQKKHHSSQQEIPLRVTANLGTGDSLQGQQQQQQRGQEVSPPIRASLMHRSNESPLDAHGSLGNSVISRPGDHQSLQQRPPQPVGHFQGTPPSTANAATTPKGHVSTRQFTHPSDSDTVPAKWRHASGLGPYADHTRQNYHLGTRQVEHTANPPLAQTNPAINPQSANAAYQAAYYGRRSASSSSSSSEAPPTNSLTEKRRNERKFNQTHQLAKARAAQSYTHQTPNPPTTKDPLFNNPWGLNTFSNKTLHTVEDIRAAPELYQQSQPKRLEDRLPHDLGDRLQYERSFAHAKASLAQRNFHDPSTWNYSVGQDNQPPEFRRMEQVMGTIANAETDPVLPQRAGKYDDTPKMGNEFTLPEHIVNAITRHGPKDHANPKNRPSMSHQMAHEVAPQHINPSNLPHNLWDRMDRGGYNSIMQALSTHGHLARMSHVKNMHSYMQSLPTFLRNTMDPTEEQKLQRKLQHVPPDTLGAFPAWSLIVQAIDKYGSQNVGRYLDASTRQEVAQALNDDVQQYKRLRQKDPNLDNSTLHEALQARIRQQQNMPTQSVAKDTGVEAAIAANKDPNAYRADLSAFDTTGRNTAESIVRASSTTGSSPILTDDRADPSLTQQRQYQRADTQTTNAFTSLLHLYRPTQQSQQGLPHDMTQLVHGVQKHPTEYKYTPSFDSTAGHGSGKALDQSTLARIQQQRDTPIPPNASVEGNALSSSGQRPIGQQKHQGLRQSTHGTWQNDASAKKTVMRAYGHHQNAEHSLAHSSDALPQQQPLIPIAQRRRLGHQLLHTYWSTQPNLQSMYPSLRSFEIALHESPLLRHVAHSYTRNHAKGPSFKPDLLSDTVGGIASDILRSSPHTRMETISQDVHAMLDVLSLHIHPTKQGSGGGTTPKADLSALHHVMQSPYLQDVLGRILMAHDSATAPGSNTAIQEQGQNANMNLHQHVNRQVHSHHSPHEENMTAHMLQTMQSSSAAAAAATLDEASGRGDTLHQKQKQRVPPTDDEQNAIGQSIRSPSSMPTQGEGLHDTIERGSTLQQTQKQRVPSHEHEQHSHQLRSFVRTLLMQQSASVTNSLLEQTFGASPRTDVKRMYQTWTTMDKEAQNRVWTTVLLPFLKQLQDHQSSLQELSQTSGANAVHQKRKTDLKATLQQYPTLQNTLGMLRLHPDLIAQQSGRAITQDTLESIGMDMNLYDTPYRRNQTERSGYTNHRNALWTDENAQAIARVPRDTEAKHRVNAAVSPWLSNQEYAKLYGRNPAQMPRRVDQPPFDPRNSSYSHPIQQQQNEQARRNVYRQASLHAHYYY